MPPRLFDKSVEAIEKKWDRSKMKAPICTDVCVRDGKKRLMTCRGARRNDKQNQ
jgi:hypothetical protein